MLGQSDFTGGDVLFWVEETTETDDLRHVRIDLGIDRTQAQVAHQPTRNVDFAFMTVVKLEKVTPDTDDSKQLINLPPDVSHPEWGRKLKSKAKLTRPLQDVEIHFTLLPDTANKADLHASLCHQKPQDTDAAVKTDAQGGAESAELSLSRFCRDTFTVAAYVKHAPPVKDTAP
ncbi:hypothetical protein [Corallococcus macrosporus]|uniref:Uncharacterized protein n=1 Tax=Myxococcus fulvus (strain ATCC BAA-855 / HW-1) TaxID=483219 RepID=F8CB25_MYXFH|nr:hypothetical protein [Corallococcus macrosporus]AEI68406.1 hypothetical protein LILAB_32625 [Corallococcus macrosporus]